MRAWEDRIEPARVNMPLHLRQSRLQLAVYVVLGLALVGVWVTAVILLAVGRS